MLLSLEESCRFGMGVDTLLQQTRGEAIEFDGETTTRGGQTSTSDFRLLSSQTDLLKTLDISVGASARFGLGKVDARMAFAESNAVTTSSVTLAISASVVNPPRHMHRARLKPDFTAMWDRDPAEFQRRFGDMYIDEIHGGGKLTILFTFATRDESSTASIRASLNGEISACIVEAKLSASFESSMTEAQRHADLRISAFVSGGRGVASPTSLSEAIELHRSFSSLVADHGVPYLVTAKPWVELPMPSGTTLAERSARRDTIEHCGHQVIRAIEDRARLSFIIANPQQFVRPDLRALEEHRHTLSSLIPQCAIRARDCSQDTSDALARCNITGLEYPTIIWPERVATAEPLGSKLEWIRAHGDPRSRGWLDFADRQLDQEHQLDPRREGRWAVSNGDNGGVFWTPETGAHVVYGGIFARYVEMNHCQGRLGYPTSDEQFLDAYRFPRHEGHRVSFFEHGSLWWDGDIVREGLPPTVARRFRRRLALDVPSPRLVADR